MSTPRNILVKTGLTARSRETAKTHNIYLLVIYESTTPEERRVQAAYSPSGRVSYLCGVCIMSPRFSFSPDFMRSELKAAHTHTHTHTTPGEIKTPRPSAARDTIQSAISPQPHGERRRRDTSEFKIISSSSSAVASQPPYMTYIHQVI